MTNKEIITGEVSIPHSERKPLKAVDTDLLDKLIQQCLAVECPDAMQRLRLNCCGPYVASEFRTFQRALTARQRAVPKNREETESNAQRAGDDLAHAISQMQHRLEIEEKEEQLFNIDDQLIQPSISATG